MTALFNNAHGRRGTSVTRVPIGYDQIQLYPVKDSQARIDLVERLRLPPFTTPGEHTDNMALMFYDKLGNVELMRVHYSGRIVIQHPPYGEVDFYRVRERAIEGTVEQVWQAGAFVSAVYSREMIVAILAGDFVRAAEFRAVDLYVRPLY